jgi:hypothetical protein
MSKRSQWLMILIVCAAVVAAVWIGHAPLYRWLLELHGIHH